MTTFKQFLLAGAAGLAMTTGLAVGSANAFDHSYWKFYLEVDPNVDIDLYLDPNSMTTVEAEQLSVGDIEAVSFVKDIEVEQPGDDNHHGGGWFDWNHHDNNGHHGDNNDALDAVAELGSVVSAATAVANNVNVDSVTTAVFTDIDQTAKGDYWSIGDVKAKSIVLDIKNLTVDSNATAVSNNANVGVDVGQRIAETSVVANIDQASFMDVTALSVVKDVTVSGYSGLGVTEGVAFRPVVNSVATAVGNNVNVSVFRPTPTAQ